MAESATAKAVEVVRQETEVVMNDAENRHRAQLRELEAKLHDAAVAAAAKEDVIGVSSLEFCYRCWPSFLFRQLLLFVA